MKKSVKPLWEFLTVRTRKLAGRVVRAALAALYILIACYTTMLTGCASLMPTREGPVAEPLGYNIWDWNGWTFVFITEAVYNIEVVKLNAYKETMDIMNKPALEFHEQAVDWLNVGLSASMFGGAPALYAIGKRKKRPGDISKEDAEKDRLAAGLQDPDEFKKTLGA